MEQLPILRRQAKPQDLPALFTRAFERELERITMAQFLEPARVRHRHLTKHYARYFTLLAEQPHLLYGSKESEQQFLDLGLGTFGNDETDAHFKLTRDAAFDEKHRNGLAGHEQVGTAGKVDENDFEPHLPKNQPGARRVDNQRVISGIIHMLKCAGRWADCPPEYGPSTTGYDRWNRWSRRGIWTGIRAALTEEGWLVETGQIDSSHIKTHRSAGGAKRGARANAIGISRGGRTTKIQALVDVLGRPLRLVLTPGNTSDVKGADLLIAEPIGLKRVIADHRYDANRIRATLRDQGTIPVIPGRRNRKRPIQYDERRYKDRWRVEAMFCRLKDFRRIATRYDKLARNFLSAVSLAAAVAFWL